MTESPLKASVIIGSLASGILERELDNWAHLALHDDVRISRDERPEFRQAPTGLNPRYFASQQQNPVASTVFKWDKLLGNNLL